jgi:hypothetical protein
LQIYFICNDFRGRIHAAFGPRCRALGGLFGGRLLQSGADVHIRPSLLIDMEDGRTTEAEHTIGDLLARAQKRGVSAPILTAALCSAGLRNQANAAGFALRHAAVAPHA